MSATVAASPERVWRAITDPTECVSWDDQLLEAVDPHMDYPSEGQHIRWRYRVGSVQLIMHDRPQAILPYRKLQSRRSIGSLRFDETYTLSLEEDAEGDQHPVKTRLGMKIIASNSVPLLGAVVDRFEVRRMSADRADSKLRSITKWCENNP